MLLLLLYSPLYYYFGRIIIAIFNYWKLSLMIAKISAKECGGYRCVAGHDRDPGRAVSGVQRVASLLHGSLSGGPAVAVPLGGAGAAGARSSGPARCPTSCHEGHPQGGLHTTGTVGGPDLWDICCIFVFTEVTGCCRQEFLVSKVIKNIEDERDDLFSHSVITANFVIHEYDNDYEESIEIQ